MSHPGSWVPPTPDAEIIAAEQPGAVSVRTDEERLALVRDELVAGFEALSGLGPAVSIWGSARVPADAPEYALGVEVARRLGERGLAVITGGGPGLMEAANRGAREAGTTSVGLNILLPAEQGGEAHMRLCVQAARQTTSATSPGSSLTTMMSRSSGAIFASATARSRSQPVSPDQ